jgi:hypothetical protein
VKKIEDVFREERASSKRAERGRLASLGKHASIFSFFAISRRVSSLVRFLLCSGKEEMNKTSARITYPQSTPRGLQIPEDKGIKSRGKTFILTLYFLQLFLIDSARPIHKIITFVGDIGEHRYNNW